MARISLQSTHLLKRRGFFIVGVLMVLTLPTVATVGFLMQPFNAIEQDLAQAFQPPSTNHLMGTDQLGRDMFSRVMQGALISTTAALGIVCIASISGVCLGLLAGYAGGCGDMLLMRITDMFLSFPPLVLALVIAGMVKHDMLTIVIAMSVVMWPPYARLTRDHIMAIKQQPFMLAAHALGASHLHTATWHFKPRIIELVLILTTFDIGGAIAALAGLSFIGIGPGPPTPEWGVLIAQGYTHLGSGPWWLTVFPTVALFLFVGGLTLISDGLRDMRMG